MIPRAGPRWYIPLPWLPPPPASQMIVQTCWCSQRYKIAMKEKIMLFLFVQNFWFYNILQNIFFQLLYVFSVSFTLSVKIGNFKRPNLFLVHVLRYVAASVLRVLNSYLMRRQRWRDRGEEGVSVTPSPRYSSGCQIIFSQTFNFPILATTRAIHWKLPDQSGQATVTISYRPGLRRWSGTQTDVP